MYDDKITFKTRCQYIEYSNKLIGLNYYFDFFTEMPESWIKTNISFESVDNLDEILNLEAEVSIKMSFFGNKAWIRLAANVYNSHEDYIKLRDRLAEFLKIPIKHTLYTLLVDTHNLRKKNSREFSIDLS